MAVITPKYTKYIKNSIYLLKIANLGTALAINSCQIWLRSMQFPWIIQKMGLTVEWGALRDTPWQTVTGGLPFSTKFEYI